MITAGTYRAKATGQVVLGTSKEKGTPFIEFYFQIVSGENAGGKVRWTSYFTDTRSAGPTGKTPAERTIEALQTCGWDGEDIGEFSDNGLHGLDANEVDVVVELEEYNDKTSGEPRTSPRVQWVNRAGGYLNVQAAMQEDAAVQFGDRMRGLVLAMKKKNPVQQQQPDTSFNYGANTAPPNGSTPPAPTGRKF